MAYRLQWKLWPMRSTGLYRRRIKDESGRMGTMCKARNGWSQMGSEPSRFVTWERVFELPFDCIGQSALLSVCVSAFGKTAKELTTARSHTWACNDPVSPILHLAVVSSAFWRGEAVNRTAVNHRLSSPNRMIFSLRRMQGRLKMWSWWFAQ